jgi:hypothetical protein
MSVNLKKALSRDFQTSVFASIPLSAGLNFSVCSPVFKFYLIGVKSGKSHMNNFLIDCSFWSYCMGPKCGILIHHYAIRSRCNKIHVKKKDYFQYNCDISTLPYSTSLAGHMVSRFLDSECN